MGPESRQSNEPLLKGSLPHNADAEHAILGGILMDPVLIDQTRRLIPAGWFHISYHRYIYQAMLEVNNLGQDLNPIVIGEHLKKNGLLEKAGGITFITQLTYGLPHFTNVTAYAEILREKAKARRGIRLAYKFAAALQDGADHPDKMFQDIIQELSEAHGTLQNARRPMSIDELYDDIALRYMLFHKGISNAIPTGFPNIDKRMIGGGLVPGYTYVLAGRPSMGKSTLALDIACNIAQSGRRVYIVTREMPRESLIDRMVAAKSDVERFHISAGISEKEYKKILETLGDMRPVPIVLDDSSISIQEVDGWLGEYERLGKRCDVLLVDYMQLMSGEHGDGRVQEVSGISRGLKGICMRREISGIWVSQLSRANVTGNREPELYDLRESGQIEQDADFVGFLHGDPHEEGLDFYTKELLVKKQREGPQFREPMDMNCRLVTFRTPDMLGHNNGNGTKPPVKPRTMGEEELVKKTRRGERLFTEEAVDKGRS